MDLDYSNYLQFFLALIFVLGLIGAVAIVLRHFGLGGAIRLQRRLKGERQRLEVTDVIPIDAADANSRSTYGTSDITRYERRYFD